MLHLIIWKLHLMYAANDQADIIASFNRSFYILFKKIIFFSIKNIRMGYCNELLSTGSGNFDCSENNQHGKKTHKNMVFANTKFV